MKKFRIALLAGSMIALPALALAEDAPVSEMSYILNTFSFLIMGVIGLILASIVNIFLGSPALHFAISVIGGLIVGWGLGKTAEY